MQKLYRFYDDYGRMGTLEGIFVEEDWRVEKAYGKTVYFGEVLGKHSDVWTDLEKSNMGVLTDDQDFIKKYLEIVGESGYNPLVYLDEAEEDWDKEDKADEN